MLKQSQMICEILEIAPDTDFPTFFYIKKVGNLCTITIKEKGQVTEKLKITYEKDLQDTIFPSMYSKIMNNLKEYSPIKYKARSFDRKYTILVGVDPGIYVEFECSDSCDKLWWKTV